MPQPTAPSGRPRWARKRLVLPALALSWLLGVGMGAAGPVTEEQADVSRTSKPRATVTATATATATATKTAAPKAGSAARATPRPTVTVTETVKEKVEVRSTVTAAAEAPAADSGSADSDPGDTSSVSYGNCSEARAADAAPVHEGEPGYGPHLDRDGDGVGCDS